jgi:ketosteroid isomerase-like protein
VTLGNVEIVRALNAAFDEGQMDAFLDLLDPDVELRDLDPPPDLPAVVRGRDAVARVMRKYSQEIQGLTAEVEEYLDLGDEAVVCVTRWRGEGGGGGTPGEESWAELHVVRDGVVVRSVMGFTDRRAALAAAHEA